VTSCGASVIKFRVGDEVYGMLPHDRMGALAEYVCFSRKGSRSWAQS
jgi:NADPH:quinone reductase-like Zn-dependent oxidoreductase